MHASFLWVFYIVGGILSMWKRANLSANNVHTPWQNVKEYASAHGPQLGINILLSTALFWSWWHDPAALPRLLSFIGLQADYQLPLNPFTSAIYGIFSDNLMDFIVAKGAARFQKPPDQAKGVGAGG
jgi:hypothetical protein